MSEFVWGLITMGYSIAGLFFLRFWVRTRTASSRPSRWRSGSWR